MPDPTPKSLTVGCAAGLANRLRVLVSGLAWEHVTGRRFTLLWPRNAPCSAAFDEMFEPLASVRIVEEAEVLALPPIGSYLFKPMFDIGAAPEPHLRFRSPSWLVPPRLSSTAAFVARLLPQSPAPFTATHEEVLRRAAELFDGLQVREEVRERVDAFARSHFREQMIGVHLRRADFASQRPDAVGDLRTAERAVQRYLKRMPDAGIFLATDDGAVNPYTAQPTIREGVVSRFRGLFGDRLVATVPRSLDRRDSVAIHDALVDLLLLRKTDALVGTTDSSFSALAVFGRNVPCTYCRAANPMRWVWRLTLVEPIVVAAGVWQFGRVAPFSVLSAHYQREFRKWLGRG